MLNLTLGQQARDWTLRAISLYSLDVYAGQQGLRIDQSGNSVCSWEQLEADLGEHADPQNGAQAVVRWVATFFTVANSHPDVLRDVVRVLGIPVGHPLHPGPGWIISSVHGKALDLGFGIPSSDNFSSQRLIPVSLGVWMAAKVDVAKWWPRARVNHERMGELAALRYVSGETSGRLRPMGGHDVITLLGAGSLRKMLADRGVHGMTGVAVPVRHDGWVTNRLIDPAFASVASGAADVHDLGFIRPVLVTVDEIVQPPEGGEIRLALDSTAPVGADSPPVVVVPGLGHVPYYVKE